MAITYKLEESNIKYSGNKEIPFVIGDKIVNDDYEYDSEGNIIWHKPIVNAIDIDWQNAEVPGLRKNISSTSDLLSEISNIATKTPGSIPQGVSDGIPIYDSEMIEEKQSSDSLPSKFISIDTSYNLSNNETLISQLITTVNALQAEVTKLQNTFKKGIYSYNNEATYMSATLHGYGDIDSEEPLWAIDESDLTTIENFEFNLEESPKYIDDGILNDCDEQRMFVYMTVDSTDVQVTLCERNNQSLAVSFNFNHYIEYGKCNIMLIVSRMPEDKEYPANFIYFSITDYTTNNTLKKGYLDSGLNLVDKEENAQWNKRYYVYSVDMTNSNPSKFNVYVDDKALGNEVIPSIPEEDDTSYRVAHIAIRSCKNYNVISKISKQLVNNELIFDESTNKLYIKTNNKIINIGASGGGNVPIPDDEETIMTNQEIIKALEAQGIITITYVNPNLVSDEEKYAPDNIDKYSFNNVGSVRFTHEETGKVYEFKTNAYGELESKLIEDTSTLAEKLSGADIADDYKSVRGLIGQLGERIAKIEYNKTLKKDGDHGLFADRIRIGNVYAPLSSDVTHGCSHAYVELENTSNIDYNLTGCQLHFIKPEFSEVLNKFVYTKRSLKLTGILPAGSTYLIRGKKYIENDNDSNCFIHVNTYDQEWYDNGELIDLSLTDNIMNVNLDVDKDKTCYAFILSYHGKFKTTDGYANLLSPTDNLYNLGVNEYTLSTILTDEDASYLGDMVNLSGSLKICDTNNGDADDTKRANSPLTYPKGLIDAIEIGAASRYTGSTTVGSTTYTLSTFNFTSNCLYKGTYELDPAKQAFNGFTMRDSSRNRWAKKGNDYQYIKLAKDAIEFPKSPTKRLVEFYSPKASFEHKNVITDKTKPNYNKPNAVSVSFGQNAYTTRCFNWVSTSNTDEYVWIYDSSNNLLEKFESYKYTKTNITQKTTFPRRKEFPKDINNIAYCDYRENTVIDRDNYNKDVSYSKYALAPRCCGLFAGSNDFFVAHKCVVDIVENPVNEEQQYSYIVGQADKNGNPNEDRCSERRYFTLYPESYKPVIYQITDQQGFHWIEYQVWAAAAIDLNNKINADVAAAKLAGEPIMPIIINTGDMTQSGSRVNEWLDYYIAGDSLFSHYEQVNITGNNDLNGTDIQSLGTGDDPGKSNPYYYYVFNCNEVNNFFTDEAGDHYPIVNKTYVPSFYYIDFKDLRIVLMNSEITVINCRDWYNLRKQLTYGDSTKEYTVNIYTGFSLRGKDSVIEKYVANDIENFTPLYTLLWHALTKSENGNRHCIVACHEMPYTVITQACCSEAEQITRFRSISDAATGKLIGSHLNQIDATEDGAGVYWFSRLLESKGVKLCIGGHKHTYAITYPVRENYKYYVDGVEKTSKFDGPMEMPNSLQFEERQNKNDYKVLWSWKPDVSGDNPRAEYQWYKNDQNADYNYGDGDKEVINWTKFPLAYRGSNSIENMPQNGTFYPVTALYANDGFENTAVTYIMCQATGYKLTSNKELPTPNQKFSRIIPMTNNTICDDGTKEDTPNNNQKFPMYIKYVVYDNGTKCDTFLSRATNIFNAKYKFDMSSYNANNIKWHYLIDKSQYVQSEDENNIQYVKEYDSDTMNTSSLATVKANATVYDNYGLWLNKEKKMIDTIML